MTGNRWGLVVAAGLVVFMVALDTSIVTVALPTIGGLARRGRRPASQETRIEEAA